MKSLAQVGVMLMSREKKMQDTDEHYDFSKILLAQSGDQEAMSYLLKKYKPAINRAARKYENEYGKEDCYAEAQCVFLERVVKADDVIKFRTSLVNEIANGIVSNLNPYGLTRRHMQNLNGTLFKTTSTSKNLEPEKVALGVEPLSRDIVDKMKEVLSDSEFAAVTNWLEFPDFNDRQVSEECGMLRMTYRYRLASAFTKLRNQIDEEGALR